MADKPKPTAKKKGPKKPKPGGGAKLSKKRRTEIKTGGSSGATTH